MENIYIEIERNLKDMDIKNNIDDLNEKFLIIKKKGWIKEMRKGPTNLGYTFESLIGKKEDFNDAPDYKGIEIKTKRNDKFITLFCMCLKGEELSENKRILKNYGYPDKEYKNNKRLMGDIWANKYQNIGTRFAYKLNVDYKNERIYLYIIDTINGNIDKKSYWDFENLKERLNKKLNYLALVKAKSKIMDKTEIVKYENINFYKLKNFKNFLMLIEEGKIKVVFNIGTYKSGPKKGQIYDHGTSFRIEEKYLDKLFEKIVK